MFWEERCAGHADDTKRCGGGGGSSSGSGGGGGGGGIASADAVREKLEEAVGGPPPTTHKIKPNFGLFVMIEWTCVTESPQQQNPNRRIEACSIHLLDF